MTLEEQLRTYGDEVERIALDHHLDVVAAVSGEDATKADVPRGTVEPAPRRRSLVIVAGIAAAVVLVLATVLVATRSDTEGTVVDAGPTPPTATSVPGEATVAPPPAEPDSPMSLWLSANRVPPGPVEVVAVLVNHVGTDATFGVEADVERWSGSEWQPLGRTGMCLDRWFCTAGISSGDFSGDVNSIGIGASPERPGTVERFTLNGLEPGWYRISQTANEGIVATGVIEIAADADLPAPLAPVRGPAIEVGPAVLPPGGGTSHLTPLIQGDTTKGELAAIVAGLADEATIERWNGEAWTSVTTAPLEPGIGGPAARTIAIPALAPGEYRIVRIAPNGEHVGRFWVADLTRRQNP